MRSHIPTIDYIQPFLNIKGECITRSYRKEDSLVYEVILPVTEHICPYCGHTTKYMKDYRLPILCVIVTMFAV